jgi:hypothetical protein
VNKEVRNIGNPLNEILDVTEKIEAGIKTVPA